MKQKWTRGEKLLWLAPLLMIVAGFMVTLGPRAAKKMVGMPTETLEASASDTLFHLSLSQNGAVLGSTGMKEFPKTASDQGQLYFWDAHSLQLLSRWDLTPRVRPGNWAGWATAFALSPDGKCVCFGRYQGTFGVYEIATHRPLWQIRGTYFLSKGQFSPDGKVVGVTNSVRNAVQYSFYDAQTGKPILQWTSEHLFSDEANLVFSPDGKLVASTGPRKKGPKPLYKGDYPNGRCVEIRQFPSGKLVRTLPLEWTERIQFSPQGDTLSVVTQTRTENGMGIDGSTLVFYAVNSGQERWRYGHLAQNKALKGYHFSSAAFSPDGKTIAVYEGIEGKVVLLDTATGEIQRELKAKLKPSKTMNSAGLRFSPDGKRLFVCEKQEILVWDMS